MSLSETSRLQEEGTRGVCKTVRPGVKEIENRPRSRLGWGVVTTFVDLGHTPLRYRFRVRNTRPCPEKTTSENVRQ